MTRKEEIKQMVKSLLASQLKGIHYNAFIFGSQANYAELKKSDIDIGIDAQQPLTISQLTHIMHALDELPTLYPFDAVDFSTVRSSFKARALHNIEPL